MAFLGHQKKAIETYERAISLLESNENAPKNISLANIYCTVAEIKRKNVKFYKNKNKNEMLLKECNNYLEKALLIFEAALGNKHREFAKHAIIIANYYYDRKKFDTAIHYFMYTIPYYKNINDKSNLLGIYSIIRESYMAQNKKEEALLIDNEYKILYGTK